MIVKSPFDGTTPQIHPTAFIAKDAVIIGDVEISAYVNMWFGQKLEEIGVKLLWEKIQAFKKIV